MKKTIILLAILISVISLDLNAQLVVGTNNPDQQAVADMSSSNKGVLIPRVSLSSTSSISPFSSTPATAMLVYNTATVGDVTPGFYYYGGANWVRLVTDASSTVTGASLTFGTSPNYVQYNTTTGKFEYNGNATVWDDLRIQILTRTAGTPPTYTAGFGGNTNLYSYQFNGNTQVNMVYFEAQMPHGWAGTTIYPHVHWCPTTTGTGTVRWYLEYTWVNVDGTFGASSTLTMDGTAGGTAWVNLIAGNATGITPSGSQDGLSSLLVCRLYRDPTNAADTYADPAALVATDIHFEKNCEGSNTQTAR